MLIMHTEEHSHFFRLFRLLEGEKKNRSKWKNCRNSLAI